MTIIYDLFVSSNFSQNRNPVLRYCVGLANHFLYQSNNLYNMLFRVRYGVSVRHEDPPMAEGIRRHPIHCRPKRQKLTCAIEARRDGIQECVLRRQ